MPQEIETIDPPTGGGSEGDMPSVHDLGEELASEDRGDIYGITDDEFEVSEPAARREESDEDDESEEPEESEEESEEDESEEDESEEDESEDDEGEEDESEEEESEDESEEEESEEDLKGYSPKAVKQIKKLRARAQEAETARSAAETAKKAAEEQLQSLRVQKLVPTPTPQDPLADVVDAETLGHVEETHRTALEWMEDHEDAIKALADLEPGEEPGPEHLLEVPFITKDGKPLAITKADFQFIKQKARTELRALPQRRAWLEDQTKYNAMLRQGYPDIGKPGTALRKEMDEVISQLPELKRNSRHEGMALALVAGRRLILKLGPKALEHIDNLPNPSQKKAGKPKRKSVPGARKSSPQPTRKTRRQKLKQQNRARGSEDVARVPKRALYGITDDELQ